MSAIIGTGRQYYDVRTIKRQTMRAATIATLALLGVSASSASAADLTSAPRIGTNGCILMKAPV
ncbi:hypothetical protein [Streptomyces sp. SGAir0957]